MASDGLAGLQALVERAEGSDKRLPPVENWHPEHCGKLDIIIKRDGSWHYMGSPIGRERLVKLFSTVLRKDEDGQTHLVTPVEKITIVVEDAHFIAVEMNVSKQDENQILTFRTNVGEVIEAGSKNPIRFAIDEDNGGVKPYLLVRGRLEALLARSVMYELIACGVEAKVDGIDMFGVESAGAFFAIMPMRELSAQMSEV